MIWIVKKIAGLDNQGKLGNRFLTKGTNPVTRYFRMVGQIKRNVDMAEERKYLTNEAIEYCESLPERHFSRDPRKFRFYEWLPVQYRNFLPDDGLFVVPGQYYVHQLDYLKEHFDSYIGAFNSLNYLFRSDLQL